MSDLLSELLLELVVVGELRRRVLRHLQVGVVVVVDLGVGATKSQLIFFRLGCVFFPLSPERSDVAVVAGVVVVAAAAVAAVH